MGRKKQMVKRLVENRRTAVSDELRKRDKEKEVSKEEHEERLKKLKELGLIK